ncbi:hypothetical protein M758_UG052800 [Ceratodon purpureus]|nr:hypothetical protein M758_UG052800 [Ceratodon purpureus]
MRMWESRSLIVGWLRGLGWRRRMVAIRQLVRLSLKPMGSLVPAELLAKSSLTSVIRLMIIWESSNMTWKGLIQTFIELQKGVQDLYSTSNRLDSRLSGVCYTAVKIGEHLQIADRQKFTANETINLIKYLTEFKSRPLELIKLSPLFSDDARVIEAAAVALKLWFVAVFKIGGTGTEGLGTPSLGLVLCIGKPSEILQWMEEKAEFLLMEFSSVSQLAFTGVMYPFLMTGYIGQTAYPSKHLDEVKHAFFKSVPGC